MEGANILTIFRDVALMLSATAVAFFAWRGLKTWRKELIGKARFEVTRNMWHSASGLRSSFEQVRNPFTSSIEWADRAPQTGETATESQVLNEWHARAKRFKGVVDNLNRIIEVQWEAEILFDEDSVQSVKDAVKSYRESYAELSSAISSYFDCRLSEVKAGELYQDQEWLKGLHKIIYGTDDELSKKVNNATDKLSLVLKQYVK